MDDGIKPEVMHEAEAQRQHPRVRIPAIVTLDGSGDATTRSHRVQDLSAGGFSFDPGKQKFKVGDSGGATLRFTVKPMGLNLPVQYRVRNVDPATHRVGCSFEALGASETSVLRLLITAYLSGEVVSSGELLTTLSRNNFTEARPQVEAAPASGVLARGRALTFTALMFAIGVAAFAYTAYKLYTVLFVTHAIAAKVAAETFTISMPRDGTFFSLIPQDGLIQKGQAIGTFQAAMLDVMQTDPGSLHLTPQQLSELMGETLKGTVSSPCDCRVEEAYAHDAQYVNRNQPLVELMPQSTKPYVLARFHFDSIDQLSVGRVVSFHISGEDHDRVGKISKLRLLPAPANPAEGGGASDLRGINAAGAISDMLAEIEPAQALDPSLLDTPVDVTLGDPRASDFTFQRARALLPTR